jgi:hypothetical protein
VFLPFFFGQKTPTLSWRLETPAMRDPNFLLPRGVYRAPVLGPKHELIIYAVRTNHCIIAREDGGVLYLSPSDNPFSAMAQLWERLNEVDPVETAPDALPAAS